IAQLSKGELGDVPHGEDVGREIEEITKDADCKGQERKIPASRKPQLPQGVKTIMHVFSS
ncbi:MAG: hypothetical protein AABY76_01895, partial [Planctomycetota bacterium]